MDFVVVARLQSKLRQVPVSAELATPAKVLHVSDEDLRLAIGGVEEPGRVQRSFPSISSQVWCASAARPLPTEAHMVPACILLGYLGGFYRK